MFERYKSVTLLNNAILRKTFAAIFINIGILYLLINADFQESSVIRGIASGLPGGSNWFFHGDYSDLDRDWYSKVSIGMIVLVLTNLFSSAFGSIVTEIISKIKRKYLAKRQLLQHDMNNCMDGAEFNIARKYAGSLAIIFCVMTYFGPIPILLPI